MNHHLCPLKTLRPKRSFQGTTCLLWDLHMFTMWMWLLSEYVFRMQYIYICSRCGCDFWVIMSSGCNIFTYVHDVDVTSEWVCLQDAIYLHMLTMWMWLLCEYVFRMKYIYICSRCGCDFCVSVSSGWNIFICLEVWDWNRSFLCDRKLYIVQGLL